MGLETELAFFEENRAEWLKHHKGKYALIRGRELQGMYDTPETAYQIGVKLWGIEPFLIKEVVEQDRVFEIPAYHLGLMHAPVRT